MRIFWILAVVLVLATFTFGLPQRDEGGEGNNQGGYGSGGRRRGGKGRGGGGRGNGMGAVEGGQNGPQASLQGVSAGGEHQT